MIISRDKPYKQPFYKNIGLLFYLLVSFFTLIYLIINPPYWLRNFLTLTFYEDDNFKYWLLFIIALNFIIDFIIEKIVIFVIEPYWNKKKISKIKEEIQMNPNKDYKLNLYHIIKNYDGN